LTPGFVQTVAVPEGRDRALYWDADQRSFGLSVTDNGAKSWVVQYRVEGRSRRMHLAIELSLRDARKQAKAILGAAARGEDPLAERRRAKGASLASIAEEYLAWERERGALRSIESREAVLKRTVLADAIASMPIDRIKKTDVLRLLDGLARDRGPVAADEALSILSRLMNWHAGRSDDFRPPILRGLRRVSAGARARTRILSDDELRLIWKVADASNGPFARLVQFLLVTAVRRNEATKMCRTEIEGDVWTIPQSRMKNKRDFVVPLTPMALDILSKCPRIGKSPWVFTRNGTRVLTNFSGGKRLFDESVTKAGGDLPHWTLHDLRRTARTLMSRAKVDPDHAERVMAHVVGGMRGIYDRFEYFDEKRVALELLANLLSQIVKA
jgi:integrase